MSNLNQKIRVTTKKSNKKKVIRKHDANDSIPKKKESISTGNNSNRTKIKKKPVVSTKATRNKVNTIQQLAHKRMMPLDFLYPSRFPLHFDTIAIQTARIGGLIILVIGGAFTALYAHYIWNLPFSGAIAQQITATALQACDDNNSDNTFESCITEQSDVISDDDTGVQPSSTSEIQNDDLNTITQTSDTDEITTAIITKEEKQPPATFSVQEKEPLSGIVPIRVWVPSADVVDLFLFSGSYTTLIPLGRATQVQNNVWAYRWDTTQFPDGRYKLAADISNAYNGVDDPYRSTDGVYLTVDNTAQPDDTSKDITPISTQIIPQSSIQAVVSEEKPQKTFIKITAADMKRVVLYATHSASKSTNIIADKTDITGNRWVYVWDTSEYISGDYEIKAKIQTADTTYYSDTITLSIQSRQDSVAQIDRDFDNRVERSDDTDINKRGEEKSIEIPQPELKLPNVDVLSGIIDMEVEIPEALFVELWAIPEGSKIPQIIGVATKNDVKIGIWDFTWNTRNIPNGTYSVYPRVKNSYGTYDGAHQEITITNKSFEPILSDAQKEQEDKINEAVLIASDIKKQDDLVSFNATPNSTSTIALPTEIVLEDNQRTNDTASKIVSQFSDTLDEELQRLVTAYRSGDPVVIDRAEERMTELKKHVATSVSNAGDSQVLEEVISNIDAQILERKKRSATVQKIIADRVGAEVFKDSDSDGITDYDEKYLYKTNPYSADTDKDGFNDGIEIMEGYNPIDSTQETVRIFESPKEKGIVRDDILTVDSIVSISDNSTDATNPDDTRVQAVITGKALPNSYVTLYIFSLPTVVTVKTEADGSWQYRFDKELEDGKHEIYVGVTDNAGKIVAKSMPFKFVKEAQAFTPEDASSFGNIDTSRATDDGLLSQFMVYLILSVSVVSIGLVLILLGLHLDTRRKLTGEVLKENE